MDTDKINAKKHSTDSNFLKRKKCYYFNIHGKINYKIGKFPLLICLISFIFIFQTSFCHRLNKRKLATNQITLKFSMSKAKKSAVLIGKTNDVSSMVLNGESMAISNKGNLAAGDSTLIVTYSKTLTDCSGLFTNSLTTFIDMSQFDTSQCTSFAGTFKYCNSLSSIILGENFSTAKAKDMSSMFDGVGKSTLCTIDRLDFDTSEVTTMKRMFAETGFKLLDLSSFNTAKVVSMEGMFISSQVISLDLTSFDTSQVETMGTMFSQCNKLISLEISNFDFSKVTEVNQIFFSMSGKLKFCNNDKKYAILEGQFSQTNLVTNCNDECFNREVTKENKFLTDTMTCVKSCQDTDNKYEFKSVCYKSCANTPVTSDEIPVGSFMCVEILDCTKKYYNYEKTECLDSVPDGFYCNDNKKRTIDYCPIQCATCNLTSVNLNLCNKCNTTGFYYEAKNYEGSSTKNIACFMEAPEGYYFNGTLFLKCHANCKTCSESSTKTDNKCTECKDGLVLDKVSNCFEKCPNGQYYYFDDSDAFQCIDSCPSGYMPIPAIQKCIKDCRDHPPYIYQFEEKCFDACPDLYHAPHEDKICEVALVCAIYYNYDHNGCWDELPDFYYCNDTAAKTVDKCPNKCQRCTIESLVSDLCTICNNEKGFYKREDDDKNTDEFMDCYSIAPEGYFIDNGDNLIKKCYKTCKNCDSLGNNRDHQCSECNDDSTKNDTNCYKICDYYYYFDDTYDYFCTNDEQCPPERSKLIIDKNECVEACVDLYKFEFQDICYTACPPGSLYNYDRTNCLGSVPIGYYQNDTQTIDKCDSKCEECDSDSVQENICISCNNILGFYKKEDILGINGFYDCFTGHQDGYYLDIDNTEYKKCHKTCKSCDEKGDVRDNKCTECYLDSTLNGTNCYKICPFYHYFDDAGEYFCTDEKECPNIRSKLIVDTNECVEECIGKYKFEFDNKCYSGCPPGTYYNYTQTGCIDAIPVGYYLNDSTKQTIDRCDIKCSNECILDFTTNNVICKGCNNGGGFYKKEDGEEINGYYDCYTGKIETYYLDTSAEIYRKCFSKCKFCTELGDIYDHKCTDCFNKFTLNNTNCYEICDYNYYFDLEKIYHCTDNEDCPSNFPNKIPSKKKCVDDCLGDEAFNFNKLYVDNKECVEECINEYRFEFDNKCYYGCPPGTYYNYTQTGCIDTIPIGYYLNDSTKQTIDKCDVKCNKECILDKPTNNVICKGCNNAQNYYKKVDGEEINGYYECYIGQVEKYYLDIPNNEYKNCFSKCKFCSELGDIYNHKCTDCYPGYTLNDTFCYEKCEYLYYFDQEKLYHCTEDENCPSVAPFKIREKKACIDNCLNDDTFKYYFKNMCYKSCSKYYNYEQTGCIEEIPDGYYLNDSVAKTIDKCDKKCATCNKESVGLGQCITCNNQENYYSKENDSLNVGNYINCYNTFIEGFYVDKKDKRYNKCFEKCKNCYDRGIITDHKCDECFSGFTLNGTNCYEICPYYYYFTDEGIYQCTEKNKCPNRDYKIIKEKNKCIDKCKNDDKYIYTHRKYCRENLLVANCKDDTMFVESDTKQCTEMCDSDDFLQNFCSLRNNTPINQDFVISMLEESIESGYLDEYIEDIIKNISGDFVVIEDGITYHLSALKSNNLIKNPISDVSSIDLGDCEVKLRNEYNLDKDKPLIVLKIDYYTNTSLVPIIGYEVFDPSTFQKLDLSICESNNMNISVPVKEINESTLYIYDTEDIYYSDECTPSVEGLGYDLILSDRQNYYITNNLSLCENNCEYKGYNTETKTSICLCSIKTNVYSASGINNETHFIEEFPNPVGKESSSTNSMKCTSTLFSKNGIIKNIALYIYLILFIISLIMCIQFYRKGYLGLKNHINFILATKEKKTEEELPKMENVEDYSDKINQKTIDKILKLRTPKNFRTDFKGVIAKDDINYQDNYSNNQKSINKLEIYNFRGNDVNTNNYHLETEKEVIYSDFEINSFTYMQAIGVDMRSFRQIYFSFIKYYHPILFLFNQTKDYNSKYIKMSLIIFSFSLYYFVNSLFITKTLIHKIYEKGNTNDIGLFIPYILISFIICYILDKIIRYISLSDSCIYSVYVEALYNNAKIRANQVRKLLFVKYICFYILGFTSLLIFGYYLATFGSVYQNTQYILIKNVIISYVISLIFPFIIIALPSILRRYALKDATRQCIFKLSRILQNI